jgi:hypothetical protein
MMVDDGYLRWERRKTLYLSSAFLENILSPLESFILESFGEESSEFFEVI